MNGLKWMPVVVAIAAVAVFVPRLAAQAREVGELPELTLEQAVRNTLASTPSFAKRSSTSDQRNSECGGPGPTDSFRSTPEVSEKGGCPVRLTSSH